MEQFRKTLEKRNNRNYAVIIFAVAANIFYFPRMSENPVYHFVTGMLAGLIPVLIVMTLKNRRVMKDDARLREMHIKENDERLLMIKQKAGSAFLPISAIGLGAAATVSLYFDQTIFFTLLGAMIFMALVKIILRLYYTRKL